MITETPVTARVRLAILVVYAFDEEHSFLFDIHLNRIRRHTAGEYRIYCAAVRLPEDARRRLDEADDAVVVDCLEFVEIPGKPYRRVREHSHYLNQLLARALEDDPTHVVTLHTDSFPIRDDWVAVLTGLQSMQRPLVTLDQDYTACLLMTASVAREHPSCFLPTAERVESDEFAAFRSEMKSRSAFEHPLSGTGYMFAVFAAGLNWTTLRQDAGGRYADVLFHLGGALWRGRATGPSSEPSRLGRVWSLASETGGFVRSAARALYALPVLGPYARSRRDRIAEIMITNQRRAELDRLLRDGEPDGSE